MSGVFIGGGIQISLILKCGKTVWRKVKYAADIQGCISDPSLILEVNSFRFLEDPYVGKYHQAGNP